MLICRQDDELVCPSCYEELFNEQDTSSHRYAVVEALSERCSACGKPSWEVDKDLEFNPSEYDGSLMGFDPAPDQCPNIHRDSFGPEPEPEVDPS